MVPDDLCDSEARPRSRTLQPRFGSLRARVRHADTGGRSDEVRPASRPLRAPRSMGRVACRDHVARIEIATALAGFIGI